MILQTNGTMNLTIVSKWYLAAVLTSLFASLFTNASAQTLTVDEIIQINIETRGGIEKWAQVKSIKMQGTYVSFSEPAPFTIWRQRPDLYRFDSNILGRYLIHAYDGERAWWFKTRRGRPNNKPVPIPSKNNLDKVTLRERFFEPVFWGYSEKGRQVELLGKEDLDGNESYKLKVTLKDSSEEIWFIDAESFLENAMTGDTYDSGRKRSLEMFFSDYRDIEGVKMPFLIESEYGIRYRSMEIDKISINQTIEQSIFALPDSAAWKNN